MKKVALLVALTLVTLVGGTVWADTTYETNADITDSSGYFFIMGNSDSSNGTFAIYYDDVKKTMVIRIRPAGAAAVHCYCYKNSNPDLYDIILTFIQKSVDDWQTYNQKYGSNYYYWNPYKFINLWYKSEGGKHIIMGASFAGAGV